MTILIIGLLLFALAPKTPELFPQIQGIARIARLTGLGLAIVGLANATIKQIDAGHVGVQSFFGKVQELILKRGAWRGFPVFEIGITFTALWYKYY